MTTLNELAPVTVAATTAATVVAPSPQPEDDWFKPCALIPVYNHERSLPAVVAALRAADLPCVLVDDGSQPAAAAVIDQLAEQPEVFLHRHLRNQGKGGAVISGLREAQRLGFSHALQVDADGQHDLSGVELFLDRASQAPDALICGYPQYDASVPKGRLYARYLTHVWVWINTLSLSIRDSMCGFRVYPLAPTLVLIDRCAPGPAHGLRHRNPGAPALAGAADDLAANAGALPAGRHLALSPVAGQRADIRHACAAVLWHVAACA